MRRFIHIIGSCVFCLSISFTILFAEGFAYDPEAREVVKKGIVYFEDIGEATLFVDGEKIDSEQLLSFAFSGKIEAEVRVAPGVHELMLYREGYIPWKKTIGVPVDRVVRFPPLILLPEHGLPLSFENSEFLPQSDLSTMNITPPTSFTIADSFHVIFINKALQAFLCDRDRENCQFIFQLDTPIFGSSAQQKNFFTMINGTFMEFQFTQTGLIKVLRTDMRFL